MTFTTNALLRHFVLGATGLVLAASSQAQSVTSSPVLLAQAAPAALPAATTGKIAAQQEMDNKKRWSVYWGWNRSNYSNSDIHFSGSDHDFTLKNVQATDLQSDAGIKGIFKYYLNPAEATIPQTNLRVAYQWNEDTAIALNLDHMKYVVTQDQSVDISGQIKGVPSRVNRSLPTTG
ncbi:MAG: hypothetical protein U5M53_01250 [Rhodoferax sp.]|nr:hypothetical protein [Rhodoferax sp.]